MNVESIVHSCCPLFLRGILSRIQDSPIGYRLAKGAFWSLSGAVISRGLALVASILVGRLLGKEAYGELGVIRSTVGMFGTLAGFGLGTTATKYVAELRDRDLIRAGRIIALSQAVSLTTGSLMAGLLVIFSPWLAANTLAAPHLAGLLRASALLLLFSALNGAESGVLAGFEDFRAIATRNLWAGLAHFPLMLGGVLLFGLAGAVWALVAGMCLNWLLSSLAVRRVTRVARVPCRFWGCWAEIDILWRFSLPAALGSVMVGPIGWACNAMLVNQPSGYAEMGIYTAAHQFQYMLTFVGSTLGAPLLSMITHQRDTHRGSLARVNMVSTWVLGVLPAIPLLTFPEIAEWLFGEGFGGDSFRWTVIAAVFATTVIIYKQGLARVLTSQGLMWWGFLSNLLWGAVLLGAARLFIGYGAVGLAISYVIAYGVNTIVFVPFYQRRALVPSGTLLSLEAGMIWGSLIVLAFLGVVGAPPIARVAAALIGAGLILLAFRRMLVPGAVSWPRVRSM